MAKRKYDRRGHTLYTCSHCGNAKLNCNYQRAYKHLGLTWKRQPLCDKCWPIVHPPRTEDLPFQIVEIYPVYDAPVPGCAGRRFMHYRAIFDGYPELRGWVFNASEEEVEAHLSRICSDKCRRRAHPDSRHYVTDEERGRYA